MDVLKLSQDYTNKTKRLINHVLVCAGIKKIQNMKIINISSQACPNSTYFIGLLINGNHNTRTLLK
jgi:hypothetical protein